MLRPLDNILLKFNLLSNLLCRKLASIGVSKQGIRSICDFSYWDIHLTVSLSRGCRLVEHDCQISPDWHPDSQNTCILASHTSSCIQDFVQDAWFGNEARRLVTKPNSFSCELCCLASLLQRMSSLQDRAFECRALSD